MRIGIIGGGSIGILFAAYLSKTFPVTLYTRTSKQAEEITRNGIWVRIQEEMHQFRVSASPFTEWQGCEDLTIITVKQYHLEKVLERISFRSPNYGHYLFLQNGMGHIQALAQLENQEVYVGSVEHGALRTNGYSVNHNGMGVTKVAVFRGDPTFLQTFISHIPDSFPMVFEPDYYEMLVKKLVVNAMINPLSAILQVKNGQLIDNPEYFVIFKEIFKEVNEILKLENQDEYWENVINVCEKTAQNTSSMLKDIANQQPTEVEAILGYLLKEANKKGVHAPHIRTFYHLIKGKEHDREDGKDV